MSALYRLMCTQKLVFLTRDAAYQLMCRRATGVRMYANIVENHIRAARRDCDYWKM